MNNAAARWWWSVCTRRVSLIGIHTMFVDSLHINRWLCGDNVQQFLRWQRCARARNTHRFCRRRFVCLFLIPRQSEGAFINLSISEEESQSLSGVWAGIPEQMSPCTRPVWSTATTKQKKGGVTFALLPSWRERSFLCHSSNKLPVCLYNRLTSIVC